MTHQSPHDRSADAVHEGRPVEAQYVRGGRGGVRILLLGMWFLSNGGFDNTNANTGHQPVDTQAFSQDAATPPTADAPTTSTGQPTNPPTGTAPNVNAPTTSAPAQ